MPPRTQNIGTYKGVEITPGSQEEVNAQVDKINSKNLGNTPSTTPITSPIPAPTGATAPNLPEPNAPIVQGAYINSLSEQQETMRKSLEDIYKTQKTEVDKKLEEATIAQQGYLSKIDPSTRPTYDQETRIMQNQLDAAEASSRTIQGNFEANQKLVNELDSLLTAGQEEIKQAEKNPTGMLAIPLQQNINRTMQDVAARAGVINSVLAARNGQIAQAHNIINQSRDAVKAQWEDQLNYYGTLLDYNDKKIISLDKESKTIAEKQVALVENDLARADETAEYIKKLMIDPESAQFVANAGVKMTDSIQEINAKMSEQSQRVKTEELKNELTSKGYEYVPFPGVGDDVSYFDVGGKQLAFKNPVKASGRGFMGALDKYENDLDAIIGTVYSTIPTKFGQATFEQQIGRARDDADKLSLVAAQVLKGQPAEFKNDFRNQAVGISQIDKAIAEIDKGAQTGVLNNALQYTYNLAGRDFDPKLARIQSYITSAIQPYRNSITGAAWGEQEDGEYASLFGSTKYSPIELRQRLVQTKELLKSKSAEGLNAFVNPLGTYENAFNVGILAQSELEFSGTQEDIFDEVIQPEDRPWYKKLWDGIF